MKNIILTGTSRAGKTSLAIELSRKLGYNVISIDSLVYAFGEVYPELNITHSNRDGSSVKNLSKFLWAYIKNLVYFQNANYVFEGVYFDMNDIIKLNKNFVVILLIHGLNAQEIFENIKNNDSEKDWTKKKSNQELFEYCKNLENMDKFYESHHSNNILIYKTGKDRKQVFQKIIKQIKTIQQKDKT